MVCARCRTINPAGTAGCASCGQPLDGSGAPVAGYPPPPYVPPGYVLVPIAPRWSGMAIAGFVLSFLAWLAVLGLIFSILGLRESRNGARGEGLAIAGIVISAVVLLLCLATVGD
jgi:hypothetical protein